MRRTDFVRVAAGSAATSFEIDFSDEGVTLLTDDPDALVVVVAVTQGASNWTNRTISSNTGGHDWYELVFQDSSPDAHGIFLAAASDITDDKIKLETGVGTRTFTAYIYQFVGADTDSDNWSSWDTVASNTVGSSPDRFEFGGSTLDLSSTGTDGSWAIASVELNNARTITQDSDWTVDYQTTTALKMHQQFVDSQPSAEDCYNTMSGGGFGACGVMAAIGAKAVTAAELSDYPGSITAGGRGVIPISDADYQPTTADNIGSITATSYAGVGYVLDPESEEAASSATGTIAQTLPSLTQSNAAEEAMDGSIAQTLPSLTQSNAAEEAMDGAIAQTLPSLSQSNTAKQSITGTAAQTLPSLSQSNTAVMEPEGTIAQTLPSLTQSAAGVHQEQVTGTATQTLPSLTQSNTSVMEPEGAIAQTLPSLSQVAAGTHQENVTGTSAQTLPSVSQSASGAAGASGTSAQTLPSLSQSASGEQAIEGTSAQTLPSLTQTAGAVQGTNGTVTQTLPSLSQSAAATNTPPAVTGTATQTLPSLSQSATVTEKMTGTSAQTLPSLTQASIAGMDPQPVIAQTLPSLSQAAVAAMAPSGSAAQTFPSLTQSLTAQYTAEVFPYTTSMKLLITDLKAVLQANIGSGNTLYGIKTVKRGILPPRNQYPLITILPLNERIVKRYSNRKVQVAREVQIVLVSPAVRGKEDIYKIQELADKTLDLLRDNTQVPDSVTSRQTTFWADFGSIAIDSGEGVEASFTATYYSHEFLEKRNISGEQTDDVAPVTLVQQIYNILNSAKSSDLSSVREVFREDWGTIKRLLLPSVTVVLESQDQRREWAGQDRLTETVQVKILSSVASASDTTLLAHLDILEPLKDLIQAEGDWTNRVMNSEIQSIDFGQRLGNNDLQYETIVTVRTDAKHLVP